MRRMALMALVLGMIVHVTAASVPEERQPAAGFGGFPISKSLTSMWLAGSDKRPLLMVYFHGPEGWHDTKWKIDSKLEKGKPLWAEFKSENATLRLWLDPKTGETEIQSAKFNISVSNTFLVLHAGEPSVSQKIVPLGVFDLLASKDQPASVLSLRADPSLGDLIKKEISASSTH
jgi:hypothetical protein